VKAACALLVSYLISVSGAAAQPVSPSEEAVRVAFTPYLWAKQTSSTSGTTADGGFAFELRAARAEMLVDTTASPSSLNGRPLTIDAAIGFRAINESRIGLDVRFGVRVSRIDFTVVNPLTGLETPGSDNWTENIGGSRLEVRNGRWWAAGVGDVGGRPTDQLGSSLSVHLEGLFAYRLTGRVSMIGGYKSLHIWRHHGTLDLDLAQHGVTFGIRVDAIRGQ
jgi:hypothetical protein